MGTGYVRNDTANSIANGNVIDADALDGEFNAVESAFNAATGHNHDGTAANGAPITKLGPTQDVVVSATAVTPKTTNTVSLGTSVLKFKDAHIDGILYTDDITLNGTAITATAAELNYTDGVTSNIQTQLDNKQPLDADLTAIGALAKTDGNIIVGDGTTWVAESGDTARASLGVSIGSQVQAWDANLDQLAALTPSDNYFVVGNGTAWTAETPADALVSLGVTATAAELNYVDGVTSNVQTQLNKAGTRKVTVLTSGAGATFTPDSDTKAMKVIAIGGGGGGGGVDGQGASTAGIAGPGGGGGTCIRYITSVSASYLYTIGAGGSGGVAGANPGLTGGTTTFSGTGVSLSATGGTGGEEELATSGDNSSSGGAGGTATGGTINIGGGDGAYSLSTGGSNRIPGVSGAAILGGGTRGVRSSSAGGVGNTYGAGGSGASVQGVTTNYAGGDGANGIIIVEEFK